MNKINRFNTPEKVTDVIKKFLRDFELSERRNKMEEGKAYYRSLNQEIMDRKFYVYAENDNGDPVKQIDPYKANNKLASGYFKILVDQKINYLLGNDVTIESDDREELEEVIDTDRLQTTLKKVGKEASKKAIGWVQVYVDENGDFKYTHIPAEQVIPVYKADNKDELEMAIRYYKVTVLDKDGNQVKVNRVEVWDEEMTTYYQESANDDKYYMLMPENMEQSSLFHPPYDNPRYHFQRDLVLGQSIRESEGLAWEKVPFIPLYNNDEGDNDLQPIKRFIDAMDIVKSDFINNLEDFQDVYWVLKGYGGQNLNDFLKQVKQYRALKVADDGDARSEQIDIPTEARKEASEQLERDIFTFGQGVNPNQLGDGNITNVVIKSRFANLDLKADQFEDEIKAFMRKLMYFINKYREINGEDEIDIDNLVFDRTMIMNEVELLGASVKQKGSISEQTRLSNHPWVSNAEAELDKIDAEMSEFTNLGPERDEETEEVDE